MKDQGVKHFSLGNRNDTSLIAEISHTNKHLKQFFQNPKKRRKEQADTRKEIIISSLSFLCWVLGQHRNPPPLPLPY